MEASRSPLLLGDAPAPDAAAASPVAAALPGAAVRTSWSPLLLGVAAATAAISLAAPLSRAATTAASAPLLAAASPALAASQAARTLSESCMDGAMVSACVGRTGA